ncbi:DUF1918 domain-containing protein [Streptomyces sp. BE147]|uniref:DUF1918 domain-containing protein n=1 Tax=unclassified Streptomyces TaxID=2593676 RepID=UPI002E78A0D5|nr:DUF1918 domain-containing protein [Streptomyces sp. BE147]MEE1735129.1 DUF1918 domain-containing protein [Streptomyces sp. BE147]
MQASVGDRIRVGKRTGEIVEVRGQDGQPPYLVRFSDGEEKTVYPGPLDEVLEALD